MSVSHSTFFVSYTYSTACKTKKQKKVTVTTELRTLNGEKGEAPIRKVKGKKNRVIPKTKEQIPPERRQKWKQKAKWGRGGGVVEREI